MAQTVMSRPRCSLHADDACPPDSTHGSPAFRDGVIAVAVDEAVDSGSLYFSSVGNDGPGYRFMSVRLYRAPGFLLIQQSQRLF